MLAADWEALLLKYRNREIDIDFLYNEISKWIKDAGINTVGLKVNGGTKKRFLPEELWDLVKQRNCKEKEWKAMKRSGTQDQCKVAYEVKLNKKHISNKIK